jgi:hypothetical protein
MLRPPSLLGQTSGFVPFNAGGSVHGELDERVVTAKAPALRRERLPAQAAPQPAHADAAAPWHQAAWAPAASGRVRFVEAAVLAAVGAYFSLGLVTLVGWL